LEPIFNKALDRSVEEPASRNKFQIRSIAGPVSSAPFFDGCSESNSDEAQAEMTAR
jgi:hypothetical protein